MGIRENGVTVYAKSALKKDDMNAKIKLGTDGIEIQLLSELVNGKLEDYNYAEEVFKLDEVREFPIMAVHAPILSKYGLSDINLEQIMDPEDFKLADQVFKIADYFGKIQNRKTIIIMHTESSVKTLKMIGDTWKRVMNGVGCLLLKYPNTELAIENVVPVQIKKTEDGKPALLLRNNNSIDNIVMVKELRKQLNTDRVGTVFDTCHARMAEKYLKVLYKELELEMPDYLSMQGFMRDNKDVVKLIHLSSMVGTGCGKGHGTPFRHSIPDDIVKMNEFVDLYEKYNYSCPVTLEVSEEDFLNCTGYKETADMLEEVMKEKGMKWYGYNYTKEIN